MPIAGKIGLITGGAQGLGKAFAAVLLQKKARGICLVDINPKGKETAAELSKAYGTPVEFIHCDVSNYGQLKNAFEFTKRRFGHIDIVCNNAGIQTYDGSLDQSIKAFRVNLEAVYYGTKLGQEYMNVQSGGRGGVVVNIGSMAAFDPSGAFVVYTATKTGVVGLSRAAGNEESFSQTGVRVNCLCPTYTDTDMVNKENMESMGYTVLSPKFVAQGFAYLVEDESKNGAVMRVTSEKGIDYKKYGTSKPPMSTRLSAAGAFNMEKEEAEG